MLRILTASVLIAAIGCAPASWTWAQEPSNPSSPASTTSPSPAPSPPLERQAESTSDRSASNETYLSEVPSWATKRIEGVEFDVIPVYAQEKSTPEEAKGSFRLAIDEAFSQYLFDKAGILQPASLIPELRNQNSAAFPEVHQSAMVKLSADPPQFRMVGTLKVSHAVVDEWSGVAERRRHAQAQSHALVQTLFVGGGVLAWVMIRAVHASALRATGGKRSGILRVASTIAILCLFGGMTAAAILGRIFSA